MVELKAVCKRYGSTYALRNVSFRAESGEILGFLGRNGAGKSTTMNIIAGYLPASSGQVLLDGENILSAPLASRARIGYLPEIPPLYPDMTVREYLRFVCALKRVRRAKTEAHVNELCEVTGLTQVRRRLIANLSKGYRQRVGLAQALAANPEVLLLDEPTAGLDPKQIAEMRELIRSLRGEHTVILSSHILHEITDVCDRVAILSQGRLAAEDTIENMTRACAGSARLHLRVLGGDAAALSALAALPGAREVSPLGCREAGTEDYLVASAPGADVRRAAFEAMAALQKPVLLLQPAGETLESAFLRLTAEREEAEE